jgi:hypothetical protein
MNNLILNIFIWTPNVIFEFWSLKFKFEKIIWKLKFEFQIIILDFQN